MAVDIRATVTCSLGTLISGSVSDDYLQGNGLIRTRGSVVISGTITPAIGTIVTFSYTKGGVTRNIPRKLRVLSSFADPYRRTTSIELGCKLTYLADLRPAVNWSVFNDPNNSTYNEDDSKIVTLPIWASSVMNECLAQLGISASSIPVTNNFSIGSFDFSAGYVSVLSDILVSECYCGYLDYNEVLQIINLRSDGGTGRVYTEANIIDHGPINSGQLPGEAVTVSYSTLKLKPPDPAEPVDERERRNWERETSITGPNNYYIGSRTYSGMEVVKTTVSYTAVGDVDVPIRRESIETASTAKIAGSIGTAYVTNGIAFNAYIAVLRREIETNSYDKDGNRTRTEINVFENPLAFYGSISLDYVFPNPNPAFSPQYVSVSSSGTVHREKIVTTYRRIGTAEQQTTRTYVAWLVSTPGQQAIAENRANLNTIGAVRRFLARVSNSGLVLERTVVTINTRNTIGGRPRNTAAISLAKKGDPASNYRQQSTSQLQLALGSGTAQRRIEFSMPYAPDDFFNGPSGGPFTSYPSDAPTKSNNFGRVQNRLLLGNRNGMNLQLAPEVLPAAPFAPMYVQANGLTAQYRANGNQWSFDFNGIVCSTDALFWAAVGGTGTFWFPVAPGITTLPTTPAPVDGNITPGITVPPYNELVEVRAAAGPVLRVTSFPYTLQPQLTVLDPLVLHAKLHVARIKKIDIPAVDITVAALVPEFRGSNTIVIVPAPSTIAVAALVPTSFGRPKTRIPVPVSDISVAALTPAISSGGSIAVPAAAITVDAFAPASVGAGNDPSFSSVSLLLHMDGTNNSTTVLDSSPSPSIVTVFTDAVLSTADSKFGGASAYFDGSGGYMITPANANVRFGSGEFTVEGWIKRKGSCPNSGIICATYNLTTSVNFAVCLGDTGTTHRLHAGFYASSWNWIIDSVDIPLDEWIHYAYVRKANLLSLYKSGNLVGTLSYSGSLPSADMATRIGRGWDGQRFFNGYIDETRVTKGVGRYETGTGANANKMVFAGTNTLALPTAPFPDS
jgi:hypothetical protein